MTFASAVGIVIAAVCQFLLSILLTTIDIAWKTLIALIVVQWFLSYYPIGIFHP